MTKLAKIAKLAKNGQSGLKCQKDQIKLKKPIWPNSQKD